MNNSLQFIRDRVQAGKPIPFVFIRIAHTLGTTKAELMRVTGLSRYSLNVVLRNRPLRGPAGDQP